MVYASNFYHPITGVGKEVKVYFRKSSLLLTVELHNAAAAGEWTLLFTACGLLSFAPTSPCGETYKHCSRTTLPYKVNSPRQLLCGNVIFIFSCSLSFQRSHRNVLGSLPYGFSMATGAFLCLLVGNWPS